MKKTIIYLIAIAFTTEIFAQSTVSTDSIATKPQDSIPTLSISLAEAQAYAIENNRSLQNASIDVRKAHAARWQSIASMLPQVNSSFNYQNLMGYKLNFAGGEIPMNPNGTFTVTASVALSGTQIVAALINNISIEMSDITSKQTEQNISSQVESIYLSILTMEETIDLLKQNLENIQKLYEITLNSVKTGVSEQTDADRIYVQVSSMRSTINSTERSREMLYNSLRLQLGANVDAQIILTQNVNDLLNIETAMSLLKTQFDLNKNYNYQLTRQNTKLAKQQIALAATNYLPTVSAAYQYSYKTYFGKEEGFNTTPPNVFTFSVSLPIWSSGQRAAAITEKKLNYKSAQNTMYDAENQLRVQDKQLRFNLSSAYENYETQKANIDVSKRVFENISKKYKYGMSSILELTNSSTELISAQNNYISALLEIVNAQIELKKLLNL